MSTIRTMRVGQSLRMIGKSFSMPGIPAATPAALVPARRPALTVEVSGDTYPVFVPGVHMPDDTDTVRYVP